MSYLSVPRLLKFYNKNVYYKILPVRAVSWQECAEKWGESDNKD